MIDGWWTYRKSGSDPDLFTVGSYHDGEWQPESDHTTTDAAAERVRWLNGQCVPGPCFRCEALRETAKLALAAIDDVLARQNGLDPALNIFDNVGVRGSLRAVLNITTPSGPALPCPACETLRERVETLEGAMSSLMLNVRGCWGMAEWGLREIVGNTNYQCVSDKLAAAEAALATKPQATDSAPGRTDATGGE